MEILIPLAVVGALVALAVYGARDGENTIKAQDNAFGAGSGGRDYGPLTESEFAAHDEELRRHYPDGLPRQ